MISAVATRRFRVTERVVDGLQGFLRAFTDDCRRQYIAGINVRPKPEPVAQLPHRQFRVGRAVKVTLAATLLCGTAVAVLLNQSHVTTDNAVVTAYVLSVRSPIQGQVQGLHLRVCDTLAEASTLARTHDDQVNELSNGLETGL